METMIATGTDRNGMRWSVTQWNEPGFTEYYLDLGNTKFGGRSIVLNDEIIAALESLPELA